MNRVIKFRAWDGEAMLTNLASVNLEMLEKGVVMVDEIQTTPVTFMQFTGLHDKNGVEIYEGDIIGSPSTAIAKIGNVFGKNYSWYDQVVWDAGVATFVLKRFVKANPGKYEEMNPYNRLDMQVGEKDMEVIGNIYSNPDLLTN